MTRVVEVVRHLSDVLVAKASGLNSASYWNHRFSRNWELNGGPLQTALFAAGFCLAPIRTDLRPESVLDFGCGRGDSAPLLRMRFPDARLHLFDFSTAAMDRARRVYGGLADCLDSIDDRDFDLVYCSNVVEHVPDPHAFVAVLASHAKRHLVIQAPYNERHPDGAPLSPAHPKGEHVATIGDELVAHLDEFAWETLHTRVPVAWEAGEQVIFVGTRRALG